MTNFTNLSRALRRAMFGLAAGLAASTGALAQDKDLAGETVEIWVPFGPGGSTDVIARLYQPFLEKHLPGNPNVVVLNKPGGGSITGSNDFDRNAPNDGTAVIVTSPSTLMAAAFGGDVVKYDPADWVPVIAQTGGLVVFANKTVTGVTVDMTPQEAVARLREKTQLVGMTRPDASQLTPVLMWDLLDVETRPAVGLSSGEIRQAVLRSELGVSSDTVGTYRAALEEQYGGKDGLVVPLMTFGYGNDAGQDPGMPEVPSFAEFYETVNGQAPEGPMWQATKYLVQLHTVTNKLIALPEGTPEDVVAAYHAAAEQLINDPEFIEAAKTVTEGYDVHAGAEAREAAKATFALGDDATKAWLQRYVAAPFGLKD